jgi:hypothetical protein
MKYLIALGAVVALVLPATAAAKGPSEATISGPGLTAPLAIKGYGEGDSSTPLGLLVSEGGFFPQVFGQSPNPLLRATPGRLGSKYVVSYTVPGPATTDTLRQDLYPYAVGGPVTYMPSKQEFWGNQMTLGGWYRGTVVLRTKLVAAGLPVADPQARTLSRAGSGHSKLRVAIGTGAGIVLAAGALVLLRRRR